VADRVRWRKFRAAARTALLPADCAWIKREDGWRVLASCQTLLAPVLVSEKSNVFFCLGAQRSAPRNAVLLHFLSPGEQPAIAFYERQKSNTAANISSSLTCSTNAAENFRLARHYLNSLLLLSVKTTGRGRAKEAAWKAWRMARRSTGVSNVAYHRYCGRRFSHCGAIRLKKRLFRNAAGRRQAGAIISVQTAVR